MSNNNENKLVPKLRFPEFEKSGEWSIKELDELSDIVKGQQLNKIDLAESGEYPCLNGGINPSGYSDKFNSEAETITISEGGNSCGYVNFMKTKFWLGGHCYKLNIKEGVHKMFLYQLLKLNETRLMRLRVGSGLPNIQQKTLRKIKIQYTTNSSEQQKIAACLSSLDELIAAETQRLAFLREHKKGLLQNLFPQAGEKVPKFRFKEFENSGEWVEKKLGEVYEFKVTNSFSRDCLNYLSGEVKNIHYGDIHTKFNTLFDITKEIVPFINIDLPIEKIREDCYCKEGDIIFADASEDLNDIGKSIEIVNLNGEKLVSGLHTLLARQKDNTLSIGFGGFLFKSNWIRKQIQREAQGAKVLGISASRISNIIIKFPKYKKEQQKIADTLSSVDDLINAQNQKLEALQLHKKGLLQGLFPNINDGGNG